MKSHVSHTRTAHHHEGHSEHSEHTSAGHKNHMKEHREPCMHTACDEPAHHLSQGQPKGHDPKHNK